MAVRIKDAIKTAQSVEELVEIVATKRYTKARVRRLLTYILVQARESDLPEAIHVLGFTEKGRQHLKTLKEQVNLVSRIGKEPWDAMTQRQTKFISWDTLVSQNRILAECQSESKQTKSTER